MRNNQIWISLGNVCNLVNLEIIMNFYIYMGEIYKIIVVDNTIAFKLLILYDNLDPELGARSA